MKKNHISLMFLVWFCCVANAQLKQTGCDSGEKPDLTALVTKEIICFGDKAEITVIVNNLSSENEIKAYWIVGDCLEEYAQTHNKFDELDGRCTYTLYAQDSYGCIGETTIFIDEPEQKIGFGPIDLVHPYGSKPGSITITVNGGWGGYTIRLEMIVGQMPIFKEERHNQPADEKITFDGLYEGSYRIVIIEDAKGCKDPRAYTVRDLVKITTGEMEPEDSNLTIFPNPSGDGRFIIDWNRREDRNVTIELYNANGQLVYKTNAHTDIRTTIDISNQSQGVYLLHIPELNVRQKLVIQ